MEQEIREGREMVFILSLDLFIDRICSDIMKTGAAHVSDGIHESMLSHATKRAN